LDEPTSALDPEQEQRLTATLQALKGSRTIVLVTHRMESVVACDRIYVMEAGRIVEAGSHRDLLRRGGSYARLWPPRGKQSEPAEDPLVSTAEITSGSLSVLDAGQGLRRQNGQRRQIRWQPNTILSAQEPPLRSRTDGQRS
jgi:ABC-type multidrug transport system ATPase subunit